MLSHSILHDLGMRLPHLLFSLFPGLLAVEAVIKGLGMRLSNILATDCNVGAGCHKNAVTRIFCQAWKVLLVQKQDLIILYCYVIHVLASYPARS